MQRTHKAVVQAGKTAWAYVLDAATGKLIRRTDNFTPQLHMFALPTLPATPELEMTGASSRDRALGRRRRRRLAFSPCPAKRYQVGSRDS